MPQITNLSAGHASLILEHAPVAVFVSAAESKELLYANRLAKETFLQGMAGKAPCCYHVAGFSQPCPFCQKHEMDHDALLVREYRHPGNGRVYELSGQIIDWDGRPAHIEYIVDITEKKQQQEHAKAHQEELREILGNLPGGLCVYRFDGEKITPVFHNPAFYSIMGYSPEQIESVKREMTWLGVRPEDLLSLQERVSQALRCDSFLQHTFRIENKEEREARWIHLEGRIRPQPDGSKVVYCIFTDVSEQKRLEKELIAANDKMQGIVNAIPGGVAIYKVSDIFETVYFSDGVPKLSGYTVEEYRELAKKGDAADLTYREDTPMVVAKAREAIEQKTVADFEFRKQHRDGHVVWVHVQAKQIGEEDGFPLLQCVFHNITQLKEAKSEMEHLINSIPGGIASYRIEEGKLLPIFYSDGMMALSGHSREEFETLMRRDVYQTVYEPDRERVMAAAGSAIETGEVLDLSYRMRHKDGNLVWIHVNGRRMGPLTQNAKFYAVFTGMSAETRLFQGLTNDTADGIYVIEKDSYELLYVNESERLFAKGQHCLGQKCYAALHGKSEPCAFCTLQNRRPGEEHQMPMEDTDRAFVTHFREIDWNGVPAYVKYVRDATEEIRIRRERDRLEQYFQTVVHNLPGGIAVIRLGQDGTMEPEYLSEGFAELSGMTLKEAWELYRQDARAGVHPKDWVQCEKMVAAYVTGQTEHFVLEYRLKKGADGYVWVRANFSLLQSDDGSIRLYAVYHDMTSELEKKEQVRRQYNELLLQHYQEPGPNALIVGHCNITQNRILEIIDHTDSDLLKTFGSIREAFFTGLAGLVVEEKERQAFLNIFTNAPALAAFRKNETEQILKCFIQLPNEARGRYVQVKMNMGVTPDSDDITGILTVTDITEKVITDRVLHQLSVTGYDFMVDVDLLQDHYKILSSDPHARIVPPLEGWHSRWTEHMIASSVVPRDREAYRIGLDPDHMRKRLQEEGPYTFSFSVADDQGDIRTKNMTVSAIDLRLGRVCLSRTDITESVREQQGLLNMMAYTFDLVGFVNIQSGRFTMHTSRTVRENLAPYVVEDYRSAMGRLTDTFGKVENLEEINRQFCLDTLVEQLKKAPEGYDFVIPHTEEGGPRYKQINVLWGDQNHQTICLVRMDVTDMLASERASKKALEEALARAEEANQAKSRFLSTMSHDIRTPINAIMGMTIIAQEHRNQPERVADCLQKISVSSRHLLSLVNDILDMSKIEHGQIALNRIALFLPEMFSQLSTIIEPQARASGLRFETKAEGILHPYFYGDALRINQILLNLLSNAVKFTPEGGLVQFTAEEMAAGSPKRVRYRITVRDTGIGIPQKFQEALFQPFTRSDRVTHVEGTGLGLSISKGLVDLMGGKLTVESKENQGSTFQVELEFDAAPAGTGKNDLPPGENRAAMRKLFEGRSFLIAEDNEINAEILCELLNMQGARFLVVKDGRQAVAAFQNAAPGSFDAILMDIQMPVMNGYEAARAIRCLGHPEAKEIPIVAMTANAFAEDVRAALEAGMNAHVAKPIELGVFHAKLKEVLKQKDPSCS